MKPNKTKENVQLEPPALRGRRQRIKDFKQFIEANRKDKSTKELVALYCLETGISIRTILGYLKLFYQANVYARPTPRVGHKLLPPEEHKVAIEEWERKAEEERKKREEANPYDF